jgi:hypothetical protein
MCGPRHQLMRRGAYQRRRFMLEVRRRAGGTEVVVARVAHVGGRATEAQRAPVSFCVTQRVIGCSPAFKRMVAYTRCRRRRPKRRLLFTRVLRCRLAVVNFRQSIAARRRMLRRRTRPQRHVVHEVRPRARFAKATVARHARVADLAAEAQRTPVNGAPSAMRKSMGAKSNSRRSRHRLITRVRRLAGWPDAHCARLGAPRLLASHSTHSVLGGTRQSTAFTQWSLSVPLLLHWR